MQWIYVALVLLVLYGDLTKRFFAPGLSLLCLYALAIVILAAIAWRVDRESPRMSGEGRMVHFAISSLIILYLLQLLTSFSSPFKEGASHAMYMCIPLAYLWVLQKYCAEFDLTKLGRLFFMLMLPVNAVGLIQYYIDPDFLISTAYSEEGGIIIRDFLEGEGAKAFLRYPSLFASADRYSAMGLMQLYFTLIVLKDTKRPSTGEKVWIVINLASAVAALLIAGARSRILIASVTAVAVAITLAVTITFSSGRQAAKIALALSFLLVVMVLLLADLESDLAPEMLSESFPVVTFLLQSVEYGDLDKRIMEAVDMSLVPDEITFLGQGLGTIWEGKPGEFGIWSIWMESGLVWGSLILASFLVFVTALLRATLKHFLAMNPLNVGIQLTSLLLLIFALLAGLTSSFELSSGLLLCCILAVTLRTSAKSNASMPGPVSRLGVQ
jgi:hypothetical protein